MIKNFSLLVAVAAMIPGFSSYVEAMQTNNAPNSFITCPSQEEIMTFMATRPVKGNTFQDANSKKWQIKEAPDYTNTENYNFSVLNTVTLRNSKSKKDSSGFSTCYYNLSYEQSRAAFLKDWITMPLNLILERVKDNG